MTIDITSKVDALIAEMDKVVIGYADIKRFSIAAMLADEHVLLEGLPGTAKSLFVEVFQHAVHGSHSVRTQMTADVKPMDLVGVKVYNPAKGAFEIEEGPLCAKNFVLVDEINRAPGKTLSAILSAMQERRVYIAGKEIVLPDPYFVMATQNPIEQEGVYPLPEAAIDRFAMKLTVPYATADEEEQILMTEALDQRDPQNVVSEVIGAEEIIEMRKRIKKSVYVSKAAIHYIVALVRASRPQCPEHKNVLAKDASLGSLIEVGCSVRAQMALRSLARVLAALKGRDYILPEDVQEVALPVMRHRTAMTFEATAEGHTSDKALDIILKNVPFSKKNADFQPEKS